ncbi:dipeptidase [Bradyrhizobium sp. 1.29L]
MTRNYAAATEVLSDLPQFSDAVLCDLVFNASPIEPDHVLEVMEAQWTKGFSFVSLSMAADNEAAPSQVFSRLARIRHGISRHEEKFALTYSVEDIRSAKKNKKLGVNFIFQGTEPIGRDLANVGAYYRLGVGIMGLAYNFQNNVGTGCLEGEKRDLGLSDYGKNLIAEMNRVGMLVDCSHAGYRTSMDAMSTSAMPCIFSHSNPRALNDHPRNIRDDQIKACAETGGIIGIHGVGPFIGKEYDKACPADAVVRQIDYVAKLVGPQHISLGLDYSSPKCNKWIFETQLHGDVSKMGLPKDLPWGFFDPGETPSVLSQLLNKGYSVDDVRGIMGENFLRVAEKVWK